MVPGNHLSVPSIAELPSDARGAERGRGLWSSLPLNLLRAPPGGRFPSPSPASILSTAAVAQTLEVPVQHHGAWSPTTAPLDTRPPAIRLSPHRSQQAAHCTQVCKASWKRCPGILPCLLGLPEAARAGPPSASLNGFFRAFLHQACSVVLGR